MGSYISNSLKFLIWKGIMEGGLLFAPALAVFREQFPVSYGPMNEYFVSPTPPIVIV